MPGIFSQGHFRLRIDSLDADARSTSITWGAALDASASPDATKPFRIRFQLQNTGSSLIIGATTYNIFVSRNGGAYVQVPPSAPGNPVYCTDATGGISANGESLTRVDLGTPSGMTFWNGFYSSTGSTPSTMIPGANRFTELEFGLQFNTAAANPGDTFAFRVYCGTTPLDAYTVTPTIVLAFFAGSAFARASAGASMNMGVSGAVVAMAMSQALLSIVTGPGFVSLFGRGAAMARARAGASIATHLAGRGFSHAAARAGMIGKLSLAGRARSLAQANGAPALATALAGRASALAGSKAGVRMLLPIVASAFSAATSRMASPGLKAALSGLGTAVASASAAPRLATTLAAQARASAAARTPLVFLVRLEATAIAALHSSLGAPSFAAHLAGMARSASAASGGLALRYALVGRAKAMASARASFGTGAVLLVATASAMAKARVGVHLATAIAGRATAQVRGQGLPSVTASFRAALSSRAAAGLSPAALATRLSGRATAQAKVGGRFNLAITGAAMASARVVAAFETYIGAPAFLAAQAIARTASTSLLRVIAREFAVTASDAALFACAASDAPLAGPVTKDEAGMNVYSQGQRIRISASFTDLTLDTGADPPAISVKVLQADETILDLSTDIVRDGAGLYHADFTPAMVGVHAYEWIGTGAVQASAKEYFNVEGELFG